MACGHASVDPIRLLELPASGNLFIGEAVQRRLDALGRALGVATRTTRRRSPAAALA